MIIFLFVFETINFSGTDPIFCRKLLHQKLKHKDRQDALAQIPFAHYNFSKATAACCENTVGYIPVPIGVCGPLLMNGDPYHVPMATTEGTLLASTNRGMKVKNVI